MVKFLDKILQFVSIDQLKFVSIIYSVPLICYIIRKFNLEDFQFLASLILLWMMYGREQVLLLIGYVCIMSYLTFILRDTKYKEQYTMMLAVNLLYICHFYYKIYQIPAEKDICSSIMMVNISFYWISKEFDFKRDRIVDFPNYLLNNAAIFFGPVVPYKMYIENLDKKHGQNNDGQNVTYPENTNHVSVNATDNTINSYIGVKNINCPERENLEQQSVLKTIFNPGVVAVLKSLFFCVVFAGLRPIFDYKHDGNIFQRLLYLFLTSLILRTKFYFIWTLSESYFYFSGYRGVKNIFPWQIETATDVKELTSSWNIYTNLWLKEGVFKSFVGTDKFLAALLTFTMSSFYHGPNLCYFLMFIFIALIGKPIYKFNLKIKKLEKYIGKYIVRGILFVQMTALLAYLCVPFHTIDVKKTIKVWKAVYYYGHAHLMVVVLAYFFC